MKKIATLALLAYILIFAKAWYDSSDTTESTQADTPTIIPGKTLRVNIPDLTGESITRVCEIRIPEHYSTDKPVPLLVWFSPGGGSGSVASIPPIVDFDRFLVAAIPYPGNKLPRLAIKAGKAQIDSFWEYEKPMLEYIRDLVPNISEDVRIAAGFSSGAHLIGAGLDRDWSGFADYFTAYILHEGGYSPDMRYKGAKESKILVTYGLKNNSYGKVVAREMKRVGLKPKVIKLPNTGHAMSNEAIEAIREWIDTEVLDNKPNLGIIQ